MQWWERKFWRAAALFSRWIKVAPLRSLFSPPPSAPSFMCIYLFMCLSKLCFAPHHGKCSTRPSGNQCDPGRSRCRSRTPRCDPLLPPGQTQNLKQRLRENQAHMGTQCSPRRHWKTKLRSYYSSVITNSGALSYAGATVESALLCRAAFQSPPMGFVIQRLYRLFRWRVNCWWVSIREGFHTSHCFIHTLIPMKNSAPSAEDQTVHSRTDVSYWKLKRLAL